MDPLTLWVGELAVRAPVTAGTNLILSIQCAWSCARLRRGGTARSRLWSAFFVALSLATLAGAVKHGAAYLEGRPAYDAVVITSHLSTGVATFFALLASAWSRERAERRALAAFASAKLMALAALLTVRPGFGLVAIDTATGLGVALFLEVAAWRRGRLANCRTALGLALGFLPAGAYLLGQPRWPNFGPVDAAHVLMMVSLATLHAGLRREAAGAAWGAGPRRSSAGGVARSATVAP